SSWWVLRAPRGGAAGRRSAGGGRPRHRRTSVLRIGDPLMYSRVHRSSRLFAVRILAAAACLLTVAGSAGVATPTASADAAACPHLPANVACHENWMADMASYIGQRPISQVILPGSHDSGTYGKFALPIQTGESQTQ